MILSNSRILKKIFWIFCICLFFRFSCFGENSKQFDPIKFEDITIVVSTCDKYSELWTPFVHFMLKNWPELNKQDNNIPILLISNYKEFKHERVTNIKLGDDISWSQNMIKTLQKVKTKYILLLLEDYFIDAPVNRERLFNIFNAMKINNAAHAQISIFSKFYVEGIDHPTLSNVLIADRFKNFRASLQAAIWDKECFQVLLKPDENAWEFEKFGNIRSQGMKNDFYKVKSDFPINYINACHLGFIQKFALDFMEKNKFEHKNTLPIKEDHPFLFRWKSFKMRISPIYSRIHKIVVGN